MESDDITFAAFVSGRYRSLLRFALAVSGDATAAEDLVQGALLRTGVRWSSVRRREEPEAYVRQAIVRAHINTWRRLSSREIAGPPPDRPADDRAFETVDQRERLWRALRLLPDRQRAVVVLRHLYDQSEEQTAALLQCSVGTVKSQCARGLARLRQALDAESVTGERRSERGK